MEGAVGGGWWMIDGWWVVMVGWVSSHALPPIRPRTSRVTGRAGHLISRFFLIFNVLVLDKSVYFRVRTSVLFFCYLNTSTGD